MKKTIRAAALALALLFAAGTLAGCGLFGGSKKLPEMQTVDHVYKYEQTTLYTINRDYSSAALEEATDHEYISNTYADENGYIFLVERSDKDYNIISYTVHYGKYDGSDEKTVELEVAQSSDDGIYYNSLCRFADGFGVLKEKSTVIDPEEYIYEQESTLEIYGEDGQLKSSIDLSEMEKSLNIEEGQWFNVNRMLMRHEQLFLLCDREDGSVICRLGLDGTLGAPINLLPEGAEGYVQDAFFAGDNELVVSASTYGAQDGKLLLIYIDLNTGERTEVDTKNDYRLVNSAFTDAAGNLYCSDSNGIYAVDKTTLAKTELMNFINSDYIYEYGNFAALPDGRFTSLTSDYEYEGDKQQETYTLNVFTKAPDSELTPKYLITVASAGYAYNLQEQIVEFNIASDEYRIKYTDYTQYNTDEDYMAGQTKLSDDILAGNVPDILIADSQFSVSKYVNKGLFADLYTFIDKDESMKREDFLQNILTGCEIDGKLYEIPTNFYIMGFVGEKDRLAEYKNLTLREFADKVAALPEGVSFCREGDFNRENMLQSLFLVNYSSFIDRKTGKCSLNNDEGRALFEYVKTLPEKTVWEQENFDHENFDWEAYNNMYKDGKAIAQWTSLYGFNSLLDYSYQFGDGAELDFIGAPSPDREGISFTASDFKFLVSAKGAFPDAAWDFVKIFLEDEYQTEQSWGFPVRKSALDSMKQKTLDEIKEREEREKEDAEDMNEVDGVAASTIAVSSANIAIAEPGWSSRREMTAGDVETVYHYVLAAKKQLVYDTGLFDIINEEASAYFAGTKTLDEILPLMESRISIVLAEAR